MVKGVLHVLSVNELALEIFENLAEYAEEFNAAYHELDNGARIVTETIPGVHSISIGIWVKAGARDETASEQGLAHFIPSSAVDASAPARIHVFPNPYNPACGESLRLALAATASQLPVPASPDNRHRTCM